MLNFDKSVIDKYVSKYRKIASTSLKKIRHIENPPKPKKSYKDTDYDNLEKPTRAVVPKKVALVEDKKLPAKTQRISKIGSHNLDPHVVDKINVLSKTLVDKRGNPLDPSTTVKNYISNLFTLCKRYQKITNSDVTNLDFLINDVNTVLDILNNVGIHTGKGYYNSIVRFLPLANPANKMKEAYDQYYAWISPKATPPAQFKPDDYMGYTWTKFVKKVEQIIKSGKEDDMYNLLLSLFTLQAPRRTCA
jgi:hypothetical protein